MTKHVKGRKSLIDFTCKLCGDEIIMGKCKGCKHKYYNINKSEVLK